MVARGDKIALNKTIWMATVLQDKLLENCNRLQLTPDTMLSILILHEVIYTSNIAMLLRCICFNL